MSSSGKPPRDYLKQRARQLRQDASFPESFLWSRLRASRLAGIKFRRQHAIGPYIADYYCHAAKLVIELDGDSHAGRAERDERRTAELQQFGVRVLRFGNDDVLKDLDAVLNAILLVCGIDAG